MSGSTPSRRARDLREGSLHRRWHAPPGLRSALIVDAETLDGARCVGRWRLFDTDQHPGEARSQRAARLAAAEAECRACPALAPCAARVTDSTTGVVQAGHRRGLLDNRPPNRHRTDPEKTTMPTTPTPPARGRREQLDAVRLIRGALYGDDADSLAVLRRFDPDAGGIVVALSSIAAGLVSHRARDHAADPETILATLEAAAIASTTDLDPQ